jgi:phage repressor protein C with HTH and peptisase S24 domain
MLSIRRVVGPSMQPTFQPGTLVLGFRWGRPRRGSIVIAEHNGLELLKRVADVGAKGFYLIGDNQTQSTDSRTYGWFAPQTIKSVVIGSIKR